jgi:hypothetical protein
MGVRPDPISFPDTSLVSGESDHLLARSILLQVFCAAPCGRWRKVFASISFDSMRSSGMVGENSPRNLKKPSIERASKAG